MHNKTPPSSNNDLLPKTGTTSPNSILCKIWRKLVLDKDGNNKRSEEQMLEAGDV